MGALIQAGAALVAGTGPGQLNQYYGFSDTNSTTVTQAAFNNLSSVYTIPAGEAYQDAAYELECGGIGVWGSTQQEFLALMALNASSYGTAADIASTALAASATFSWTAKMKLVAADSVSAWWSSMSLTLQSYANPVLPGTAADNSVPLATSNTGARIASMSSAITVAVQVKWNSTTGAPTITNNWTTWRKVS